MAKLLVIVSYKVFPAHMGGQKGIVHFYEKLQQYHSIRMVVSYDNEVLPLPYPVDRILFKNHRMGLNLVHLNRLRKLIRENAIDAIIAEHSFAGWIAWLLKHLTGKPFLIHSHNIESSRFRQMGKRGWRWYHSYERWIHRKADFSFFKTEEERQWALQAYSILPSRCDVTPYGINPVRKIADARKKLKEHYGINNQYIFYFNGTLDYAPNQAAVQEIINNINPLLQKSGLDYVVLISGKFLPLPLSQTLKQTRNIRYLGFVEDIEMVYQASSLFINPVINDSGVKTKLVEALANHCTVVSTKSGATGVPRERCGQKLITTADGDWQGFAEAILQSISQPASDLPTAFFAYFSWENIVQKTAGQINRMIQHA